MLSDHPKASSEGRPSSEVIRTKAILRPSSEPVSSTGDAMSGKVLGTIHGIRF